MAERSFALGLGGNQGDVRANFQLCISLLRCHKLISDLLVSSVYKTQPWGDVEGTDFLNAAVCGLWGGRDIDLLHLCQSIETELGVPIQKHGTARALDVDILFLEGGLSTDELMLPHPRMIIRKFVLVPLCDIWVKPVPGLKKTPAVLLKQVSDCSSIIFEGNL
ncbi:MAG: 2-amino-4-hydroxy-6-hydroxymethyldihydropteridine diphosphokinase [bacterium]|nr:2-amino-4-hydroxy-6-hydroxymethyldihydropteridine diphosphokinase [bacterium]